MQAIVVANRPFKSTPEHQQKTHFSHAARNPTWHFGQLYEAPCAEVVFDMTPMSSEGGSREANGNGKKKKKKRKKGHPHSQE